MKTDENILKRIEQQLMSLKELRHNDQYMARAAMIKILELEIDLLRIELKRELFEDVLADVKRFESDLQQKNKPATIPGATP